MHLVLGWDIGGVNTKAALVVDRVVRRVVTRPFELQRSPATLGALLASMADALTTESIDAHAVTMTAELSQMFRTKREGVSFVLDAVERAFPGARLHVYSTDGSFVSPQQARAQPLAVAAANWAATAHLVARHHPDALLVDIGTTTTDLIPIVEGRVVARGRTDPERLASGELVYTGAVRTPVEAIVDVVPIADGQARVSAEGFALAGDVHVWLGDLAPADYDAATPDGRPAARLFAGERIARVVCADREMLDDDAVSAIANAVSDAQVTTIASGMRDVLRAHPSIATAVVTGLGAFLGSRAAAVAGLREVRLSDQLGPDGARSAPAAAVAALLGDQLEREAPGHEENKRLQGAPSDRRVAEAQHVIVVKLGGSLLADPPQWRTAIDALAAAGTVHRLVVVPGGGPFADTVRRVDAEYGLTDDAAHWMAIAGMDQHAEMIAAASNGFRRVDDPAGIEQALRSGLIPVVAPSHWMRTADPLRHSWDMTSDSIAAWVASQLHASRLVLVKAAGATGPALVDAGFHQTRHPDLPWLSCDAAGLAAQLAEPIPSPR
jgi:probable H4MPT-linked C1 transfer pathway protein